MPRVFVLPMVLQFKLYNLHVVTFGVGFWSSMFCVHLSLA